MDPEEFYEQQFADLYESWPKKVQEAYHQVQEKILYTIEDQPRIDGEFHWFLGEQVELWEVFESCSVPKRYWDDFVSSLGFDSEHNSVGIEEEWVLEQRKRERRVQRKYGLQLDEFLKHLAVFPMLGLTFSIGRRILREMPKFPTKDLQGLELFRARRIEEGKVFNTDDMIAPPEGLADEGRYNHPGMSALYLSHSEFGAAVEIVENPEETSMVWIQKFNIIDLDKVLDFDYRLNGLDHSIPENDLLYAAFSKGVFDAKVMDKGRKGKPEYLMTRFVTDCARSHGISSILYNSTKSYDTNLVLFDTSIIPEQVTPIGEPYQYTYNKKTKSKYLTDDADF